MSIPTRKNSDIKYIFLHHTESTENTTGKVINEGYNKDGQFGAPYDIIINRDGKIDLTPRWIFATSNTQYLEDVSAFSIAKYTRHHFSSAAEEYIYNATAVHVALVGNFDRQVLGVYQTISLMNVITKLYTSYGINLNSGLIYHSDVTATSCPGTNLTSSLSKQALIASILPKRYDTTPTLFVVPSLFAPPYFVVSSRTSTTITVEWGNISSASLIDHFNIYLTGYVAQRILERDNGVTQKYTFSGYTNYDYVKVLEIPQGLSTGSVLTYPEIGQVTVGSSWTRFTAYWLFPGSAYTIFLNPVLTNGQEVSTLS